MTLTRTVDAVPTFRFLRFELRPSEQRLLVDGAAAPLGSRALDVLRTLVERAGQLVTKDMLLNAVWPGASVQENNLPTQISALRKVLGPHVIATIPGRGYRLTATVQTDSETAAESPHPALALVPASRPPSGMKRLIGRDSDSSDLHRLIGERRLVTVVGPGGVGKSFLLRHMAAQGCGPFAHGVCWVEVDSVAQALTLRHAVAAALGVSGPSGDALAGLSAAIAPYRGVVVLDNAEHRLPEVARMVQALCLAGPHLCIVVTSQAPLRVAGERLFRLNPLAVPRPTSAVDDARLYGAVMLFLELATAAACGFEWTQANAASAIAVCDELDGLPLAIELAVARLAVLGVQGLHSLLRERLFLLSGNTDRSAPARHQSLRASLEWSCSLLSRAERSLFHCLAGLADCMSLGAIERTILGRRHTVAEDRWDLLDSLQVLVERSLVLRTTTTDGDGPRYRMLRSARDFALERLKAGENVRYPTKVPSPSFGADLPDRGLLPALVKANDPVCARAGFWPGGDHAQARQEPLHPDAAAARRAPSRAAAVDPVQGNDTSDWRHPGWAAALEFGRYCQLDHAWQRVN